MKTVRTEPYKVYVLRSNGVKERIDAQDIIVELRPGVEVQLNLAPHPAFAGQLTIVTPPYRRMKRLYDAGHVDSIASYFGGANVLHIAVERHTKPSAVAPKKRRSRSAGAGGKEPE